MEIRTQSGKSAGLTDGVGFAWRVFATGFCFSMFGLGGILLALTVIPPLWLLPSNAWRHRAAQQLVSSMFRAFLAMVEFLGVGQVTVRNEHLLRQPGAKLVMANHPTLLDVVVLISRMPQADCVVKEGVRKNLFMRGIVHTTGYIGNASPDALIEECVDVLRKGRSLIIFPEGTRTRLGCEMKFQRGAARIALRSGAPLQLVTITCEPPTLMKGVSWYRIPPRKWHIDMHVHEPQPASGLLREELPGEDLPGPAAAKRCTAELKKMFERKLEHHAEISGRNTRTHNRIPRS